MSYLNDPKQASRALIAFGMVIMGVGVRFLQQSDSKFWLAAAYLGFVMLIRGIWIGWKYREK